MGLVCAAMLLSSATPPRRIVLWAHDEQEGQSLARTRRTDRLAGFVLPERIEVSTDDRVLEEAELIVSAVPVQHMRATWHRLAPRVPSSSAVGAVSVAKGIENTTLLRPTQIIADVLRGMGRDHPDAPPRPLAALSGPTIAAELARCLPAAMIAASDDQAFASRVQQAFSTSWMRIYTNPDVLGVELAGAVKNVVAIAAGICDGLDAGANAKSALLARGLAEIVRLGTAMGASPSTFFGIAGVGDLATTCFSPEGRNRSCGEALGRGTLLKDYLARSPHVVEGVATTKSVVELAKKYKVEMPIVMSVSKVLFEGQDPIDAIGHLMSREQKAERVG
jgi:glycerol-3-phosphate dehydrogenase (NAD(P)+)